jgi:hypothetical protein
MLVDPAIAAAFQQAEAVQKDAKAATERQQLVADVVEAVRPLIPTAPVKTEADLAAERAMAEALAPKRPDAKLLISDPEEWQKQQDVYEAHRVKTEIEKARAADRDAAAATARTSQAAGEEQARAILREQFYGAYPVLKGSETLVNALLKTKFDEVVASGALTKPLTPAQREELKKSAFADVATRATKEIVGMMNRGKQIAPPTPPPTTVSSAPAKGAAPAVAAAPAAPRGVEKYPKGSLSRIAAERRAAREGAPA